MGAALHVLNLGARRGCLVNTTLWLLYLQERDMATHCAGSWVGLSEVRMGMEHLAPTGL